MSSLKRKSTIGFAWDMGGTFLHRGSGFIISIFLARLLSPADFGLIGIAMVFISISQVFIDVGFASALIQNKNTTKLTYSSVFYLNIFAGLLLTGLIYFTAPFIGGFYENQKITNLVRWLSLIFVFNSLDIVQIAILKKELNFKVLTLRTVVASTVGGVTGIILAFSGFGIHSLVIQNLTTAALGTVLLWSTAEWKPDFKFSLTEIKRLTGFSSFVFFDRIVSTVFQRLDIVLIGKVFSPSMLGFYTRAVGLKDQVTHYSSTSLTKVFFPVLSSLQDNHHEFSRIYFKVISVISFLSFGLTGILYILGADIIILLFGQKWEPSIQIFQVLVLSVCTYPLNSMMVNAFMSKGKVKENFTIGIFRKSILVVPLGIVYFYGIYEFTVAVVISSYLLTVTNILFLKKFIKLSTKRHFKKIFEGSIPLGLAIFIFHILDFELSWTRLLFAVGFGISYLVFNWALKTEGLLFLWENSMKIKKYFNNIC